MYVKKKKKKYKTQLKPKIFGSGSGRVRTALVHFTVAFLVAKPMNRSEAKVTLL